MINVFVIEDHPVIISGLKQMFHLSADGVKIIGHSQSVDEFLGNIETSDIDIFILDLYLPDTRPEDNVKKLKEKFPDVPIVIYTSEDSDIWKRKMMALGVHAYLTKNAIKEEIKVILQKVRKGEFAISLKTSMSVDSVLEPGKTCFTANQIEILKLLCEVKKQETIAKIRGTSISNIEKTLRLMRKTAGVESNLELVRFGLAKGYLKPL